jgi:hypothetical protein
MESEIIREILGLEEGSELLIDTQHETKEKGTIQEKLNNFHDKLMKEVIEFCKENNISADEVHFSADHLQDSIMFGKWHPGTDSCLGLLDKNGEIIIESL